LESLRKQIATWKPHYRNSPTWAVFKVNDNQHVDLFQNQTMCYIICHRGRVLPKILAMRTKCRKG
jgi:hypothetical protein